MVVIWFSAVELRNLQSIDNWTAMTKLVIFDLDGTLLDTVEDLGNATNYALRMCGFPERPMKDYYQLVGRGIYNLFRSAMQAPDSGKVTLPDGGNETVSVEGNVPASVEVSASMELMALTTIRCRESQRVLSRCASSRSFSRLSVESHTSFTYCRLLLRIRFSTFLY